MFNQLLLVEDFLQFKKLMVNRNKSLEKEALRQSGVEVEPQKGRPVHGSEDAVLKESMRLEEERRRKMEREEEEMMRKVLEASKLEAEEQAMMSRLESKAAQKEKTKVDQPQPEPAPKQEARVEAPVEAPPKENNIT